jgi:hypothetical protein
MTVQDNKLVAMLANQINQSIFGLLHTPIFGFEVVVIQF